MQVVSICVRAFAVEHGRQVGKAECGAMARERVSATKYEACEVPFVVLIVCLTVGPLERRSGAVQHVVPYTSWYQGTVSMCIRAIVP